MHRTDLQIPRDISASLNAGNRREENGKYREEVLVNVFAEPVVGFQVVLHHRYCKHKLPFIILTTRNSQWGDYRQDSLVPICTMKAYVGVELLFHLFLDLALN